ncbi:hypothetical protein CBS101457_003187 [Exobasidium rhododendri]|nr:hypothetical protein CBS101457_003187 [Exobasidium rhododendri]
MPLLRASLVASSCSALKHAARTSPLRQSEVGRRPFSLIHSPVEESAPRLAKVSDRSIISFEGRDTMKLLQGLITNNLKSLSTTNSPYCAFLNPPGRMLSSAFLFSPRDECVFVDVDAQVCSTLMTFIKRFKLRSKVAIKDVSEEYQVWAVWGKDAKVPSSTSVLASGLDVRSPLMGYRFITGKETEGDVEEQATSSSSSSEAYTIHRILQGVPDGANDIWESQTLPLEANVDYMNGVDFRKGCYVGQELTARTHYTGVVRKRVVPIQFYQSDTSPPETLQVHTSFSMALPGKGADVRSTMIGDEGGRGKSTGKYLSGIHNIGLALLRLEQVHRWNSDLLIKVKNSEKSELSIRPWIPNWWPDEGKQPM